jgi:histidine triad (HIT) family protein
MACLFCEIAAGDRSAHMVLDEPDVLAFLDIRPVFKGHTLVIPRQHHETIVDLPDPLMGAVFDAVRRVAGAVVEGLGAEGSFVANNNVISQSVPHFHAHVVPRHRGDGLRGFFWPRHRYGSDDEAADYASKLRACASPSTTR